MTASANPRPASPIGRTFPVAHLAVALMAFIVFAGTMTYDFVWDDEPIINQARTVVEEKGLAALAVASFAGQDDSSTEPSGYYRPVALFTMWINDPVGRPSAFPFHLVNVLLHAVNSLLVFVLFRMMIPDGPAPFLGGAVFAVHPVHAESVAFISGRTDLLAALFILVTVILWRRSRWRTRGSGTGPFLAGMGFFSLACLSKEIAFFLPAVIAVWSLIDGSGSDTGSRKVLSPDFKWVTGMSVVLGILVWVRLIHLGIGMGPGWSSHTLQSGAGLLAMAGDIAGNMLFYLRLLAFPWPLEVYYPPSAVQLTILTVVVSLGFTGICLSLSGRRHRRTGLIALTLVFLFLVPVSGIVGLGTTVIAPRFCYLPSVGFALAAGCILGLGSGKVRHKAVVQVLTGCIIIFFSLGSFTYAARWKDNLTLFSHAVKENPVTVPDMYLNLGNAYVDAGNHREGIEAFRAALRLDPGYVKAITNLASAYIDIGDEEQALEILNRALEIAPDNPGIWFNSAKALGRLGRTDEAVENWTGYLDLKPGDAWARCRRGELLYHLGRYDESILDFREAMTSREVRFRALVGSGRSLEEKNLLYEAERAYLDAVEEFPGESTGYLALGRVLLRQGKAREAAVVYRKSLDNSDPGENAHRGLVLAYLQSGRKADARKYIADLGEADPGLSSSLHDLLENLAAGDDEVEAR